MNFGLGHGDGTAYGKFINSQLTYNSKKSPEDTRKKFVERLRVFGTSTAERFISKTKNLKVNSNTTSNNYDKKVPIKKFVHSPSIDLP